MLSDRKDPLCEDPLCEDPILDICLEELLGGSGPPDLSDRILAALNSRAGRTPPASRAPAPVQRPAAPTRHIQPIQEPAAALLRMRLGWLSLALAAGLLVMVGAYWSARRGAAEAGADRALGPVAIGRTGQVKTPPDGLPPDASHGSATAKAVKPTAVPATAVSPNELSPNELAPPASGGSAPESGAAAAVEQSRSAAAGGRDAGGRNTGRRNTGQRNTGGPNTGGRSDAEPSQTAAPNPTPERQVAVSAAAAGALSSGALSSGALSSGALPASAVSDAELIGYIDRMLRARWKDAGVRPSPAATDAEWCRRVFLDLIGRIPTIQELESYLVDNARDKRARLVERLLTDDDYAEAYARHWTAIWTTLLVGRKAGMAPGGPVNREGLQQYLRRSFLANKPYDRMVYELVSAQGSNRPGEADFNGAVNFLLNNLQDKAVPATAKTAQLFLGVQVQCTQCHGHPFNAWKQNRFWELNAFFRQAKAAPEMHGGELRLTRLLDEDFAGEGDAPDLEEAEIYYEERNGLLHAAYPAFIDGTPSEPSGAVAEVRRREELARLIVRSDEFSQAIVNRLWAHSFGYGFTRPIDDLGPHNPASHPELLARLGREFAAAGHDLKRLLRWITLSEAYGLSSKFGSKFGNAADDPGAGAAPLFSHFYLRQMTAEQLYDSLLVATEAHASRGNYEQQQRTKDEWLEQFAIAFGTDENDEATTFDGTIAQTLEMMNGELTRQATSVSSGGFLSQVSRSDRPAANPIQQLYLAALGRRPSRAELQLANQLLAAHGGDAAAMLEDVWWALLNSNEFISNH